MNEFIFIHSQCVDSFIFFSFMTEYQHDVSTTTVTYGKIANSDTSLCKHQGEWIALATREDEEERKHSWRRIQTTYFVTGIIYSFGNKLSFLDSQTLLKYIFKLVFDHEDAHQWYSIPLSNRCRIQFSQYWEFKRWCCNGPNWSLRQTRLRTGCCQEQCADLQGTYHVDGITECWCSGWTVSSHPWRRGRRFEVIQANAFEYQGW